MTTGKKFSPAAVALIALSAVLAGFLAAFLYFDALPRDSFSIDGTLEYEQTGQTRLPENTGKININTASSAELQDLPGIGPALSGRIIGYRAEHGPFASVEELLGVSGIGEKTLEALRPYICVD